VPRDLETIIAKAMDADPHRRYPSADDLADDLERLLNLQPIHARPAGFVTRTIKLVRRNRRALISAVAGGAAALGIAIAAALYLFILPTWAHGWRQKAQLALLDPLQGNRQLATLYWGRRPEWPVFPESATKAFDAYDRALRCRPFDAELRLERDVVALAQALADSRVLPPVPEPLVRESALAHGGAGIRSGVSRDGNPATNRAENGFSAQRAASTTELAARFARLRSRAPLTWRYANAWYDHSSAPPIDEGALDAGNPLDLRCLGLLAFLCQDVVAANAAWTRLDLVRNPDPLVEASLGQLHLMLEEPARAYPRLLSAHRAYQQAIFLRLNLAEAGVQIAASAEAGGEGYLAEAERLLEEVAAVPDAELQAADPHFGRRLVKADLLALRSLRSRAAADQARLAGNPVVASTRSTIADKQESEAIGLYEFFRRQRQAPPARDHYGRFLIARGKLWGATQVYRELIEIRPDVLPYRARFVEAAELWWAELDHRERLRAVGRGLHEPPDSLDSVARVVHAYLASTQWLERASDRSRTPESPDQIFGQRSSAPRVGPRTAAIESERGPSWNLAALFGAVLSPILQRMELSHFARGMEVVMYVRNSTVRTAISLWSKLPTATGPSVAGLFLTFLEGAVFAQPSVPGFQVTTYAVFPPGVGNAPLSITFDPQTGVMYTGRRNEPGPIWRVPAGGGTPTSYGNSAIPDPDAVAFAVTSSPNWPAGGWPASAVLVGGVIGGGPQDGAMHAIYPDESVHLVFGPNALYTNPSGIRFDGYGNLLMTSLNGNLCVTNGTMEPEVLFELERPSAFWTAPAADPVFNAIYVADDSGVIYRVSLSGELLGVLDDLPGFAFLAVSPDNCVWSGDLVAMDGSAGSLYRYEDDGTRTTIGSGFGTSLVAGIEFGPDGALYVSQLNPSNKIFRIAPIPLPADLDGHFGVDLLDFAILATNWGSLTATPQQGDLDGDQDVDLADYAAFQVNFGCGFPE